MASWALWSFVIFQIYLQNLFLLGWAQNSVRKVDDLMIGFQGNESFGSVLSHNYTVMCHLTWRSISNTRKADLSLTKLDPFLCTHLVLNRFGVNSMTYALELDNRYDDNEIELVAIETLKARNSILKVLAVVPVVEFPGQNTHVYTNRFLHSLFKTFKNDGLDGIYMDDPEIEKSRSQTSIAVINEICQQIKAAGYLVAVGTNGISSSLTYVADFAMIPSDRYNPSNATQHTLPVIATYAIVRALSRLVVSTKNVLLPITPEATLYILSDGCEKSHLSSDCCARGRSTIKNSLTLDIGNDGVDDSLDFCYGLELWRVCELYNSMPGNWQIWRSLPNNEVYMCDGKHWISYQDIVSLTSTLQPVKSGNLGGVDIRHLVHDDYSHGACNKFNSTHKISMPCVRNINKILSKLSPTARRIPENSNGTKATKLVQTKKVCELSKILNKEGIDSFEKGIWLCLASKETNFTSNHPVTSNPSHDNQGCSTTRFGIFGLSSPLCNDPKSLSGCQTICNINCDDLMNNISESVKCLRRGLQGPIPTWYHRFWSYCEVFGSEYLGTEDCETFVVAEQNEPTKLWETLTIILGTVVVGSCVLVAGWHGMKRYRRGRDIMPYIELHPETALNCGPIQLKIRELKEQILETGCLLDGPIEIDSTTILGIGCFGTIYSAVVNGRAAAVKVIKEEADENYLISILSEIKILAQLEPHDNVVAFLGFTNGENLLDFPGRVTMAMVLALCSNGSLLNHLQAHRSDYGGDVLTKEHLLCWAHQIAKGMAYLSSNKICHADLAARNVLLDDLLVAKISDFGLARNLYHYNNYIKTGREPLPWRWMSIEALRDMKFSTASDVWSYGVTLYELFSLGSVPYPGLSYTPAFIEQLVVFNLRPGRPQHADDHIYTVVIDPCWSQAELDRPTFQDILYILERVIAECDSIEGYEPLGRTTLT